MDIVSTFSTDFLTGLEKIVDCASLPDASDDHTQSAIDFLDGHQSVCTRIPWMHTISFNNRTRATTLHSFNSPTRRCTAVSTPKIVYGRCRI